MLSSSICYMSILGLRLYVPLRLCKNIFFWTPIPGALPWHCMERLEARTAAARGDEDSTQSHVTAQLGTPAHEQQGRQPRGEDVTSGQDMTSGQDVTLIYVTEIFIHPILLMWIFLMVSIQLKNGSFQWFEYGFKTNNIVAHFLSGWLLN